MFAIVNYIFSRHPDGCKNSFRLRKRSVLGLLPQPGRTPHFFLFPVFVHQIMGAEQFCCGIFHFVIKPFAECPKS